MVLGAVVTLAGVAGCGEAGGNGHLASAARDSAGVRIVESALPVWSGADALRLDSAPALVIGTQSGTPYELSQVAGAARLDDGRIVIADGASAELRFFDSAGVFIRTAGRHGSGPGEFSRMMFFARMPGDTLVVVELSGPSRFSSDGAFLHRHNVMLPTTTMPRGIRAVVAVLSGGRAVLAPIQQPPSTRAAGERWIHTASFHLVDDGNNEIANLGEQPLMMFAMEKDGASPPWFAPKAVLASAGPAWYVGFGSAYEIREFDRDGRLRRVIRRTWSPALVTRADIEQFVEVWGRRWIRTTGAEAERERSAMLGAAYADTVPAFSQIIADRTGGLWVRNANLPDAARAGDLSDTPMVPSTWSVFGRDGVWLGDVTMPAHFLPHDIGGDYVLGVARDGDGVETVVLYRMRPGAQ
jgi:hypothetical protein